MSIFHARGLGANKHIPMTLGFKVDLHLHGIVLLICIAHLHELGFIKTRKGDRTITSIQCKTLVAAVFPLGSICHLREHCTKEQRSLQSKCLLLFIRG